MAVSQTSLLYYAVKADARNSDEIIKEARAAYKQTAFLSHSHKDAHLAKGVQGFLQDQGWEVYIDWEDSSMPASPNRTTAQRIQKKIRELNWFLFLATQNSVQSHWCPWEIGYADGVKAYNNILIIPTSDGQRTHGSEYLQLYRYVENATDGGFGAFQEQQGVRLSALRP